MTFEGWLGRLITLWLAVALIAGLINGVVLNGGSNLTDDAQTINNMGQVSVSSQPSTVLPGLAAWVSTGVSGLSALVRMLAWSGPLFDGAIGSTVRIIFFAILTTTAGIGIASKIRGN